MTLRDHPLFRKLASLRLPTEDYVIAGSAPMLAHGIEREINDIDVVARGAAWKVAQGWGEVSRSPLGPAQRIVLFHGDIEVLDGWFDYAVDALISGAEHLEGFAFLSLGKTMEWKNALGREIDLADVALIREFLAAT